MSAREVRHFVFTVVWLAMAVFVGIVDDNFTGALVCVAISQVWLATTP